MLAEESFSLPICQLAAQQYALLSGSQQALHFTRCHV